MSDELTPRQQFNRALLQAQQEFPPIHKTKTAKIETKAGHYSYKYADLGDVFDDALPILHKHGIALSQPPVSESGMVGVHTRLIHESGHVEDCGALLLPAGNNPQAAGSAMTYARRYAACAALGIVADEDDDGQAASQPTPDFTEQIRWIVEEFEEWDEDERREAWVRATKELGRGKPKTIEDVEAIADKVREYYGEYLDLLPEPPNT